MPTLTRVALLIALLTFAAAGFAADPMSRKKGESATFTGSSFGALVTMSGDDDVLTGTFDNDGKLKVKAI